MRSRDERKRQGRVEKIKERMKEGLRNEWAPKVQTAWRMVSLALRAINPIATGEGSFPGGISGKEPAANTGGIRDAGSTSGLPL